MRQGQAHLIGIMRGDAGGTELLQQDGFQVRQLGHTAGDIDHRFPGPDPATLRVDQVNVENRAASRRDLRQPVQHQSGRRDDGTAHEHRVGNTTVPITLHHSLGTVEIGVGPRRDIRRQFGRGPAFRNATHSPVVHSRSSLNAAMSRSLRRHRSRISARLTAGFQFLCHQEGQFQRLLGVQAWIAEGFVPLRQIGLG